MFEKACSYPAQTTPNSTNGYEDITSVHILRKRRQTIQMVMKTLLLFISCANDAKRYKRTNGYEEITSVHILTKRRQTIYMAMTTLLLFISCANDAKRYKCLWRHNFCSFVRHMQAKYMKLFKLLPYLILKQVEFAFPTVNSYRLFLGGG